MKMLSAANQDESTHTFSGQNQMEQHKYAFSLRQFYLFLYVHLVDMCLFMSKSKTISAAGFCASGARSLKKESQGIIGNCGGFHWSCKNTDVTP